MAGVNKVIIVGNLGRDPELNVTSSGTQICRLSVATTRTWKDKRTNDRHEETEWHRVTVWGSSAENCDKYLEKGRQVYIEGRLRTSSYEKEGVRHYSTEVIAEQVQFIGGRGDGERAAVGGGGDSGGRSGPPQAYSASGQPEGRATGLSDDDDIPF